MTLEVLQRDMIQALKDGDKTRKQALSGYVDAVKKAAINKNTRDNVTEELVDEVLMKCQKEIQEMIDTCPPSREDKLAEYQAQLAIIKEYAPQLITDEAEIEKMINYILACNSMVANKGQKGYIMKIVMPVLRKHHADMKIANAVLNRMCQ